MDDSHSDKSETTDDTHGDMRSIAVRIDSQVARCWVGVLWSFVAHLDYGLSEQVSVLGHTLGVEW